MITTAFNITVGSSALFATVNAYNAANKTLTESSDALGAASNTLATAQAAMKVIDSKASASLTVGASGSKTTASSTQLKAVITQLAAKHALRLVAGQDINMEGARVTSGNDMLLAAARDLNIMSAVSSSSSDSTSAQFSAAAGIAATVSTKGASFGVTASASMAVGNADSDKITHTNANISAGNTLSTLSGNDTNIVGGNLNATLIDMYVGNNLLVSSVKDYAQSYSTKWSAGAGFTAGMGAAVSANFGNQTSDSSSDFIGKQSSILGANGVNIYTENNTHIKGAVIAALNDNLLLNTGTLSFEDMVGHKSSTSTSFNLGFSKELKGVTGLGGSTSWGTPGTGAAGPDAEPQKPYEGTQEGGTPPKQDDGYKWKNDRPGWLQDLMAVQKTANEEWREVQQVLPKDLSLSYSDSTQTARATVGAGTIIVRDNPGTDLSGLNRDLGKALTQEETANFKFSLKDYTGYVTTALSMPGYLDNGLFCRKADYVCEDKGRRVYKWHKYFRPLGEKTN